jgi:hypothetical protein
MAILPYSPPALNSRMLIRTLIRNCEDFLTNPLLSVKHLKI